MLSVESTGTPSCTPEIPDCVEQVGKGWMAPGAAPLREMGVSGGCLAHLNLHVVAAPFGVWEAPSFPSKSPATSRSGNSPWNWSSKAPWEATTDSGGWGASQRLYPSSGAPWRRRVPHRESNKLKVTVSRMTFLLCSNLLSRLAHVVFQNQKPPFPQFSNSLAPTGCAAIQFSFQTHCSEFAQTPGSRTLSHVEAAASGAPGPCTSVWLKCGVPTAPLRFSDSLKQLKEFRKTLYLQ